jgi:hypothetical protein
VSLTAPTAPPPVNPKLQVCIENYVADQFKANGPAIRAAIADARRLDLGPLPDSIKKDVSESFATAEASFGLLDKVREAEAAIAAAATSYAPLHRRVREIQADMRRHDARVTELQQDLRNVQGDDAEARQRKQEIEAEIARLQQERKALENTIPAIWPAEQTKFRRLLLDERRARLMYRRNVDSAYEPIDQAIDIIAATDKLAALRPELESLRGDINSQDPETAAARIAFVLNKVNDVPGSDRIRSEVAKARRALRARTPDKAEALKSVEAALQAHAADLAWRQRAVQSPLPGLRAYERAIRDTIGLRKQERLPRDKGVAIAGCMAHHRDLSLQF